MTITNDPCTIPAGVARELARRFARGADLQATRRHVVTHHGRAEWAWLASTPHERHRAERAQAAASIREARALCLENGYRPAAVRSALRQFAG